MDRDCMVRLRCLVARQLIAATAIVTLLFVAACQSAGSTGGDGNGNAADNADLFNGADVVNSRPNGPDGPRPPVDSGGNAGRNSTQPPTIIQPVPPAGRPPVDVARPSRYGCYVPTRSYTFFEHRYVLILYRDATGREAWELTGPAVAGSTNAQATRQLGLGLFGEIPGGFEFRQLALSADGQTAQVVATDHIAALETTNRLTLSAPVDEETTGTALGVVMTTQGELHWVRITDVDLKPTAPVYGAFNPTGATGLRDPNARLHLWPDGQWRYAAISSETDVPTTIAAGGTWRHADTTLTLEYAAVDDGSGSRPLRPPETYEFFFDAGDTKALYLRATAGWTRGWLFATKSAWSVFVPYRP